jgi:hypothetical protein
MLRLSLAQQRVWAAAGWSIPVSVNVGPDCAIDPEFPAVIVELLRSERVPGRMLTLEVSEQTGTAEVSATFFAQLAEVGVRVALDDFGAGFASLESLGGWPIDELKLDMSLVKPTSSGSRSSLKGSSPRSSGPDCMPSGVTWPRAFSSGGPCRPVLLRTGCASRTSWPCDEARWSVRPRRQ